MKQFKTLLIVAIIALGAQTAQAQTKVGHISIDLLISLMPETIALNSELEQLGKTYENDLKELDAKYKAKLQKYTEEAPSQTDEVNQQRGVEIRQDEQQLMQATQVAQQELQKKRDEKLKPILEKAKKAIEEVANEQGFTYVVDQTILIIANGTDLLPAVKAKLGIQ